MGNISLSETTFSLWVVIGVYKVVLFSSLALRSICAIRDILSLHCAKRIRDRERVVVVTSNIQVNRIDQLRVLTSATFDNSR